MDEKAYYSKSYLTVEHLVMISSRTLSCVVLVFVSLFALSVAGQERSVSPTMYEKLKKVRFVYNFTFPVKKPGAYQYRVALRDQLAGSVGSASQYIEVPAFKKGKMMLSGIALQQHTFDDWNKALSTNTKPTRQTSALNDTALRRFKPGGVLHFAYEIYNERLDNAKRPDLTTRIRVFRGRELVPDGQEKRLDPTGQADMSRLKTWGAISLGKEMTQGDYILQIIVTDNLAKGKQKTVTNYFTFEIADDPEKR